MATNRQMQARQDHINRELAKMDKLDGAPSCPSCEGRPDDVYEDSYRCGQCLDWYIVPKAVARD